MKKIAFLLPLLAIAITSCSNNNKLIESKVFCFDTLTEVRLYEGNKSNIKDIEDILNKISDITDNYESKSNNGVYQINQTNEEIVVDEELYQLLQDSLDMAANGVDNFSPLCGSLSKKWKEALAEKEILSEIVINEELNKINNTTLTLKENNVVQRTGDAEIDLGAVAKGYALDLVNNYLQENNITSYLINAGSSSIALGEKKTKDGLFTIGLKEVKDAYIKAKNCFVSTSSIYEQGVTIDGVTYSHIVNPKTGSAINENDGVIVLSSNGCFGDAMSTSLMNNTVEEIKLIEEENDIKTIVIRNNNIVYSHKDIEVKYH